MLESNGAKFGMKPAIHSEIFWNAPHLFESTRAVDPLGFDALREAMSNVLAPFLTGATRHAEHYVAVAVGLRWAKSRASRPLDKDIWPLFRAFERGLLQYWHLCPGNRPARRRYLGKRRIAEICAGKRPNVQAPILRDQRGVGLLGSYIESLRAIALVKPAQIVIDEEAVTQLLGDPRFEWAGTSPGNWQSLVEIFAGVDLRSAWPRLGHRLFDLADLSQQRAQMYSAARSISASPNADWVRLAKCRTLLEPQQRIAAATGLTAELEARLREMFGELLKGQKPAVTRAMVGRLAKLAGQVTKLRVIDTVWPSEPALAKVLRLHIENAARGRLSEKALLEWHLEVMRARGTEPWVQDLGERSALKLPTDRADPDFRLTNLQTLLRETKWAE